MRSVVVSRRRAPGVSREPEPGCERLAGHRVDGSATAYDQHVEVHVSLTVHRVRCFCQIVTGDVATNLVPSTGVHLGPSPGREGSAD